MYSYASESAQSVAHESDANLGANSGKLLFRCSLVSRSATSVDEFRNLIPRLPGARRIAAIGEDRDRDLLAPVQGSEDYLGTFGG